MKLKDKFMYLGLTKVGAADFLHVDNVMCVCVCLCVLVTCGMCFVVYLSVLIECCVSVYVDFMVGITVCSVSVCLRVGV